MNRISEFLTNPEFVRWVKNPDQDLEVYWSSWLKANPSKLEDLKLAREIVLGIKVAKKSPRPEMMEEVLSTILKEDHQGKPNTNPDKNKGSEMAGAWFSQIYRVAAIIVLTLFIALLYALVSFEKGPSEEIYYASLSKSTHPGERLNFRLPDGTMVWLNGASELYFPEQFHGEERRVELKGEGFFEVAHDARKPFRVVSSSLVTTALGTSFNIRNYEQEPVSVALVTGKVEVENLQTKSRDKLIPGEQLAFTAEDQSSLISEFDAKNTYGWKEGQLIFVNEDFGQVLEKIEQWYGVEIEVVGRPNRDWNITISFENASLERVLDRIAYIEKFEFETKGKKVILKF
ncbi:hypothetical protein GCM10007049_33320 [Echinicola pacifica]|uniref:FecR family protein n=1 Tax=Echinicola pacifica TaxID=346377 RepID=A0A918QAU2_9BACT|nr:FecR family protein [Echinicola pacifica]GGZ37449.1 hypothetical protein GCM10007049_33320 [Echinicola pacifica]